MSSSELLSLAIELISAGKKENARTAIRQALKENPDDVAAWALLVQAAKDSNEEMAAVREVLRIKPDDEWAQRYLADLIDKEALNRIVDLIKLEKKDQAAFLLEQVLSRSPKNADAWAIKARLAGKREDAIVALEEVLRLRPEDERARQFLTRLINEQREIERKKIEQAQRELEEEEQKDRKSAVAKPRRERKLKLSSDLIYGFMGIILLLTMVCFVFGYPMLPEEDRIFGNLWLKSEATQAGSAFTEGSCEALINKALQVSDTGCKRIGRNEICYGNYDLTTNLIPDYSGQFNITGDIIPIAGVKQIYASPLDMAKNLWGVAVLKLQANLPGTVPGQNVTFLVFGDTSVENTSGDMSAFYFATGFSGLRCSEVPFDGLLIEMPDGSGISFQANGVDFMLEGDAILQAKPGEELTVSMIEGTGMVRAEDQVQQIGPGTSVNVPMGDDLNPTGPPSNPEPLSDDDVLLGCHLLGVGCPPEVGDVIRPPTSTPGGELGSLPPTYTPVPINPNIPTYTPVPVPPGQPTNTSVPLPTNTSPPRPTNTFPSGPTNTPVPGATDTPVPPATNTSPPPTPTNTSVPPTPTNTPFTGSCSNITISAGGSGGEFTITNNYGTDIVLTEITLAWPVTVNGNWKHSYLDGQNIQSAGFDTSPATAVLVLDASLRTIQTGTSKTLVFDFQNPAAPTGYNVTVTFDVGCSRPASQ